MRVNSSTVRLSFDANGIDAKTLSDILKETNATIKAIAKSHGEKGIDLRIHPFERGSFEFLIEVYNHAATIYSIGSRILNTLKETLEVRKLLTEGKKPEESKTITNVTNNIGSINIHVHGLMRVIEKSPDINGFSIKNAIDDEVYLKLSKSDIQEIIKGYKDEEQKAERAKVDTQPDLGLDQVLVAEHISKGYLKREIFRENVVMKLLDPHAIKGRLWIFIYDDIRIKARVKDLSFLDKIGGFKKLKVGSSFRVSLKIKQVFNEIAEAWENQAYEIVEVKDIFSNQLR